MRVLKMLSKKAMNGMSAAVEVLRQIDPEVVAAYQITPTTGIPEGYSKILAEGKVSGELITVESEHSALSACVGAAAAGVRTVTATASQGLAYMFEVLGVASGLRLPMLMYIGNRALSAPINIHCDHSDSMAARDQGWMQFYCENAQEVYDLSFVALRLAEEVKLPVMICMDGFITTHTYEPVETLDDKKIKHFVGSYKAKTTLFDFKKPITLGHFAMPDSYFEFKEGQEKAMELALKKYETIQKKFAKVRDREYPAVARYKVSQADYVIVTSSSTAGLVKDVVNELRETGLKVGCLKIRMFRPFPHKDVVDALKNAKGVAVLDRSMSFGSMPPLFSEIKNCFFGNIQSYVFGLGGRDIFEDDIKDVFRKMDKKDYNGKIRYIK